MKKILIIFAHPAISESKIHKKLLEGLAENDYITLHRIYDQYPDFLIDDEREKKLLEAHDIIVWQHPLYWFSGSALLKQWMDVVLRFNWAYGPEGNALKDKWIFNAISTGDSCDTFSEGRENQCSIHDYLRPYKQTALICKMKYLPPFWVDNSYRISDADIMKMKELYHKILKGLSEEKWTLRQIMNKSKLNELKGGKDE
jgi:glutathione-regulated potassium-efflux system ancillary protein KefG